MTGKLLTAIFLTISLISASCASHTAVYPDPVNIQSEIEPGDTVKIVTKDNEETSFVVVEVTEEAIVGESETVLFADITELQEQTVSAEKKFLWISILTLGLATFAVLSIATFSIDGAF
jgi:hypothetical protein